MTEKEIIESNSTDIVQDKEFLEVPCEETTIENGEEIANKLFRVLTDRNDGYGLAANQIGIQKQVCVINVKEPIYLINPKIVEASGSLIYYESCLSFPGELVRTKRYASITVEADNYEGQLYFDVSTYPDKDRGMNNIDVTEIVVIQHEISHLQGRTMFDYEDKQVPVKKVETFGRNDKITITDGKDTKIIKYKNYKQFEEKGYYILGE